MPSELDHWHMRRALELAARGRGGVEPNPLVGAVVARGAEIIAEGWHRRFGGPHAEVEALSIAGARARGATLYVTLEPCCHWGKTPPCTQAVLAAGIERVVVAQRDPFPAVAGKGLAELEGAGVEVTVGLLEDQARLLNAPYLKLVERGRPWVIAKWAMTLDGKLASRTGDSRWISSPESRARVHRLRGQIDAILVGLGTAVADDPLLTARPAGSRTATRIVLDRRGELSLTSQLVRTAREVPLLVVVGSEAPAARRAELAAAGCEVWAPDAAAAGNELPALLDELGRRRWTNLLVEGGGLVLGRFFDAGLVDEVLVFIAPRLVGGRDAPTPWAGAGLERIADSLRIVEPAWEFCGGDLVCRGRVAATSARDSAGSLDPGGGQR